MRFTKDEIRKAMLLYAVTDSSWLKEGQTLAEVVEDVLANGATFLQIREKEMEHGAFLAEARQLQAAAAAHRVPFVVNDAIDIALELDAGVSGDAADDSLPHCSRGIALGPDRNCLIICKACKLYTLIGRNTNRIHGHGQEL